MNIVKAEHRIEDLPYSNGSIWRDPQDNEMFILGAVPAFWVAISLSHGQSWNGTKPTIHEAIKGLEFVAAEMNISLTPITK